MDSNVIFLCLCPDKKKTIYTSLVKNLLCFQMTNRFVFQQNHFCYHFCLWDNLHYIVCRNSLWSSWVEFDKYAHSFEKEREISLFITVCLHFIASTQKQNKRVFNSHYNGSTQYLHWGFILILGRLQTSADPKLSRLENLKKIAVVLTTSGRQMLLTLLET